MKLIDFGIAKAIPADTTNISRETQIGTANYMSPEALSLQGAESERRVRMGRPTDVWALGCILYQMIYGHTPFASLETNLKIHAIRDPNHQIEYRGAVVPVRIGEKGEKVRLDELKVEVERPAIETMRSCLSFRREDRASIPELLKDGFLKPLMVKVASKDENNDSGEFVCMDVCVCLAIPLGGEAVGWLRN